jgi:hypothetical protein
LVNGLIEPVCIVLYAYCSRSEGCLLPRLLCEVFYPHRILHEKAASAG